MPCLVKKWHKTSPQWLFTETARDQYGGHIFTCVVLQRCRIAVVQRDAVVQWCSGSGVQSCRCAMVQAQYSAVVQRCCSVVVKLQLIQLQESILFLCPFLSFLLSQDQSPFLCYPSVNPASIPPFCIPY